MLKACPEVAYTQKQVHLVWMWTVQHFANLQSTVPVRKMSFGAKTTRKQNQIGCPYPEVTYSSILNRLSLALGRTNLPKPAKPHTCPWHVVWCENVKTPETYRWPVSRGRWSRILNRLSLDVIGTSLSKPAETCTCLWYSVCERSKELPNRIDCLYPAQKLLRKKVIPYATLKYSVEERWKGGPGPACELELNQSCENTRL